MKSTKIFSILFVISLLFMAPLLRPGYNIDLFPQEINKSIVNIQGSSILVTSNIQFPIEMNISMMNPKTLEFDIIFSGEFVSEELIGGIQPGNYYFEFLANDITTVIIDAKGIPGSSIIITLLVTLVSMINYVRVRFYSVIIDY